MSTGESDRGIGDQDVSKAGGAENGPQPRTAPTEESRPPEVEKPSDIEPGTNGEGSLPGAQERPEEAWDEGGEEEDMGVPSDLEPGGWEEEGAPTWGGGARRKKSPPLELDKSNIKKTLRPEEKLLILDIMKRSGLSLQDFSKLVDISSVTLYDWKVKVEELGPEALFPRPRGPEPGSRVDEATRRAILMLKESHREYGCERISQFLYRGPGLGVSASTVSRVLKEEGYESEEGPTNRHPDKPRSFERAKPNQLWQSDIFTFMLKRQGQRLHLVGFMDDHSRFITGFGLASRASTDFVLEVVRTAIGAYGPPEEMLTDRGPQYHTWRGKSAFQKEMLKRGINHIVSRPRHPQTLGKVERFWKSLWEECLHAAVFADIEDARIRIGNYIGHYNFQRPHQGLGGMVPADRFFAAGSEVRKTLEARVEANALELARDGSPRKTFYLTGRVGDVGLSLHAEGEKVIMTTDGGKREEVDLRSTGRREDTADVAGEAKQ